MLDELLSAVRDYGTACSRFSEDFDPEYETACVEAFAAVRATAERMLQPARPGFSEFAPIPVLTAAAGPPFFRQRLEDRIDQWHAGEGAGQELHEFLGLTWAEYRRLLGDPTVAEHKQDDNG